MPQAQPQFSGRSRPPVSLWGEVAFIFAITLAATALAVRFELNEAVFAMTRRWESVQLDEWPIAVLVLALGLGWLSWRRYREAQIQLDARQAAEARLADALAANRQLAHQHLQVQESERKHLARELHDELGQYLNAIKLDAVALSDSPGDAASLSQLAAERIVQAVDHVHAVVTDMIRRLRPAGLDELGLVAALENCLDQWRQRLPATQFSLQARAALDNLDELTSLTLYRLAQEGLTNIYKHAGATRVDIDLRRSSDSDAILLTLSDDGRGMNSQQSSGGFGLPGMRERVEMMGGHFTIDDSPGKGFSFTARLPAPGRQ